MQRAKLFRVGLPESLGCKTHKKMRWCSENLKSVDFPNTLIYIYIYEFVHAHIHINIQYMYIFNLVETQQQYPVDRKTFISSFAIVSTPALCNQRRHFRLMESERKGDGNVSNSVAANLIVGVNKISGIYCTI